MDLWQLPVRDYEGFEEDWHSFLFGISCHWKFNAAIISPSITEKLDMEYIDN